MHITLETDYAVRIVDCLARSQHRMGARAISEKACVTLRFSLKILRKLVTGGIVRSFKGAQGGYEIAKPLDEISIGDIIETIEGPISINRCMSTEFVCTRTDDKNCPYHDMFSELSYHIRDRLGQIKISHFVEL